MLNWIVWKRTDICKKMDLALNNLQWLICHKTQTNKQYNTMHYENACDCKASPCGIACMLHGF